jgi:hypothetical protein
MVHEFEKRKLLQFLRSGPACGCKGGIGRRGDGGSPVGDALLGQQGLFQGFGSTALVSMGVRLVGDWGATEMCSRRS